MSIVFACYIYGIIIYYIEIKFIKIHYNDGHENCNYIYGNYISNIKIILLVFVTINISNFFEDIFYLKLEYIIKNN